jgi:hypothetical protein
MKGQVIQVSVVFESCNLPLKMIEERSRKCCMHANIERRKRERVRLEKGDECR